MPEPHTTPTTIDPMPRTGPSAVQVIHAILSPTPLAADLLASAATDPDPGIRYAVAASGRPLTAAQRAGLDAEIASVARLGR